MSVTTAAVYLRQSLDVTGEGVAVARQREDCLRLCAEKGWTPSEYLDNDTSATKGKRPGYLRMLDDIRAGTVHAVVAWDLDRLHRRPVELEEFINLADAHRLALATVSGDVDLSTAQGRLVARLKGSVARHEIEHKSDRQKRAAKQLADAGAPKWKTAFGYTDDYQPHPIEAPLVRDAYEALLSGTSLKGIAAGLNANGMTGRTGKPWTHSTLSLFLRAPRNAGLREHNKVIVGPGTWPGLVSEETFRAALALMEDPARRPGPPTVKRHWLTGILKCSQCADGMGRVAGFQRSQGARPDKHGYRCVRCLKVSISKHDVDALIRGVIVARLARPDAAELLIDRNAPNLDALADEAKTIRVGLDDAATMFADGTITASQLRTATERLRTRLSATESRMAHASRTRVFGGIPLGTDQVADAFDKLDPDRQRAIVDALLTATIMPANQRGGRRAFNPERVRIEWKA